MHALPTPDISFRPLHEIAMGPLKAALMNCGIDMKVFDLLTEFTAPEEVASQLGTHPDNTRRFLDALAIIELIEKEDGRYRNRPLARKFLVSTDPACIGPLLKQTQNAGLNPLEDLTRLLTRGPSGEGLSGFADEAIWAEEAMASAGWVLGGTGKLVARTVSGLPEFSGFKTMLELGCGHGAFSLYLLSENPGLASTLFDRAPVLTAAKDLAARFGATDRVICRAGDYLTDDIGEGFDLVFASATLNFAIGGLAPLIQKIHKALRPGGYFVAFQDGMTHEGTRPDTMLGAMLPAMAVGGDYCFHQGDIAGTALSCGFQWVRSRTLQTPIGDMDMDIAP